MINIRRLTTAEAAARLGVKPATLYAYVSRGLLRSERSAKGSTFDAREVARVARSSRNQSQPAFVTAVSLIEGGHLYYRGLDAVDLSRERTFEEVAGWLWSGEWERGSTWSTPRAAREAVRLTASSTAEGVRPVERFMVAVAEAAVSDGLRHDLRPQSVAAMGRTVVTALVDGLPRARRQGRAPAGAAISRRLWPCLSRLAASSGRCAVLDAALVLSADHELAPSTLVARVAASFRADPYAVVGSALGPASGSWEPGATGAPDEVEALLVESEQTDPQRAVGERIRRYAGVIHGFGTPLYPDGDPRGTELIRRLPELGGKPERLELVQRILAIGRERGFPPPNADMGLGALSFCAEMVPGSGQAIATLGKVAGWLAHAMEEYAAPTRFRARSTYVGPSPTGS